MTNSVSGTGADDPNKNQGAPTVTLTPDEADAVKRTLEEHPEILSGKGNEVFTAVPDKDKIPKQQQKSTMLTQRTKRHYEYVKVPKGVKNKKEYLNKLAKQEAVRLGRPVTVKESTGDPIEGGAGAALGNLSAQQFSDLLGLTNSPGRIQDLYNNATDPRQTPPASPILDNPTWYAGGTNPYIPPPTFNPDAGVGSVRVYGLSDQKAMFDALTKPVSEGGAGLSKWGAAGLMGRTLGVEAPNGPDSQNSYGGGHYGIGQWGTSRARDLGWIGKGQSVNSALANGQLKIPFNEQVDALVRELNTNEKAAGDLLRNATNIEEGVRGATRFERAGGYNGYTDAGSAGSYGPAQRVYNNATNGWTGAGGTGGNLPPGVYPAP